MRTDDLVEQGLDLRLIGQRYCKVFAVKLNRSRVWVAMGNLAALMEPCFES